MTLNYISKESLQHFVDYGIMQNASLSFAPALIHGWKKWKDWCQGLEVNITVKAALGMKNKCCVNVKVYVEIVRIRIRIRVPPYPPFPLTL